MNTLKIEIPEGFEIDNFDKKTGEVKLKPVPKDIKERIKSFTDVLKHHGIIARDFAHQCSELTKDEVAYRKIKLIVAAANEDWEADYTDSSQYKYEPWFEMGSPSGVGFSFYDYVYWGSNSNVGTRLCYKSSDLCKHFSKLFIDIYKDFLTQN